MRALRPLATEAPTVPAVHQLCRRHTGLTAAALAELAPIATNGHNAHLVLFMAQHADKWAEGDGAPPLFLTRSAVAAVLTADDAVAHVADPAVRRRLEAHRRAGEHATAYLVGLAEGMIRHAVSQLRLRESAKTTVVDAADLLNTARAAVAQGVWAYDPDKPSGAHYLRPWIEEHIRRDLGGQTYQVSIPARTHNRFLRIAAIHGVLCQQLGREPTDAEILARPDAAFTQADLELERETRPRRQHTGLGLGSTEHPRFGYRPSDELDFRSLPTPVTHDRADISAELADLVVTELDNATDFVTSGWRAALTVLQLGPLQKEIIARAVGLPPHEHLPESERSERAIAAALDLTRSTVHEVLTALRAELGKPGGRLHHLLTRLNEEDRQGLGLQPFATFLGQLSTAAPPPGPAPRVLTKALPRSQSTGNRCTPVRSVQMVRYECTTEGCGWAGYERAPGRRLVLPRIRCPDCGRIAELTRGRVVVETLGGEAR
ncbi:hypothetical protein N8J89_16730 [Crossiella sp. CA-258035]|uniref:hypothetical protein n=1 Tax=Crossiella sp. CA-258035 TaxID=2981138 RepID=UPI0024BD54E2|nr:hypothetical protein [Crossiella sp. CA-258035]WHT22644.1 hypothetical protein N8J89_16730 [Crossiella sp. CA-258035]